MNSGPSEQGYFLQCEFNVVVLGGIRVTVLVIGPTFAASNPAEDGTFLSSRPHALRLHGMLKNPRDMKRDACRQNY
jgi:hypothetical protein